MDKLLNTIQNDFRQKRVVVVGDIVADQYLNGTISRVSREAPVLILRHAETETRPGGAANSAANIASLGGVPRLIGTIGDDSNGNELLISLERNGVSRKFIISNAEQKTTTKIRVLAGHQHAVKQQVIRIDYENIPGEMADVRQLIADNLQNAASDADAIVISDYGYGAVNSALVSQAREICETRSIPLVLDSRSRLSEFRGATSATPNQEEVERILGHEYTEAACDELRKRLEYRSLLVTRGNKGMALFTEGEAPVNIDAVGSDEPVDVTGAGDTVIAAYTLGLASGFNFAESATVANHAGGIVVMKRGTAVVSRTELIESIRNGSPASTAAKNER